MKLINRKSDSLLEAEFIIQKKKKKKEKKYQLVHTAEKGGNSTRRAKLARFIGSTCASIVATFQSLAQLSAVALLALYSLFRRFFFPLTININIAGRFAPIIDGGSIFFSFFLFASQGNTQRDKSSCSTWFR